MQIDDIFDFGKYKGLTLQEVYQGTNSISKDVIKGYLLDKISTSDSSINSNAILFEIIDFEISDTLLRIHTSIDTLKINWTKILEGLFRNGTGILDRLSGNSSIDDFNINKYSHSLSKPELTSGNPEYLEWCISNVDKFYIDPESIIELENMVVYRFEGIEVKFKIDDIYQYKSKIVFQKRDFSKTTIHLNQKKYEESKEIIMVDYDSQTNDYEDQTDWSNYNDDLDMDQQSEEFWNQF